MNNNVIDYKDLLSNKEKRIRLKHMYWLVLWWEEEKRKVRVSDEKIFS
ncbi:hypothetical protein Amet_2588 [Alkaliphilus metalliredigens QYMF]|uniref:Uncharacterized protein n=1 Tax=Alkaliphilus metalliredigens (strain QYMF) TaxID=293826 RepID=A6TRC2_ALKMQ|nr:hypothetical protein [Alkaliphilus metalliredigens]ABR48740.1 hypothetical protein Amet_2588 [Alkaliphilus metalliredigens QYMF]